MLFPDRIEDIMSVLSRGGIMVYPTDTIWGIGCDAFHEEAVERIFQIKQRDRSKPFVLLVDSVDMLKQYAPTIHPRVETLLTYHTKPLTIVYKRTQDLPTYLLGPDGSAGIRVVRDDFCRTIIHALGRPIVSSSANRSAQDHPNHFGEIDQTILKEVDYVVKFRQNDRRQQAPSVVATFNPKGELVFLRS